VTAEGLIDELIVASRARFTDDEHARLQRGEPVKLAPLARADRGTPSGLVELASPGLERAGAARLPTWIEDEDPDERGAFRLVCAPSVHTHNATYSHSARHARKAGPPRAFLNPADLQRLAAPPGARVRLTNARASLTLLAAADPHLPSGLVRIDGLPRSTDVPEGHGINALVSGGVSDLGGGNVLYSTRCDIQQEPSHEGY
jgi:anaerobic selenocysteine-containing dehydrogenase